MSLTGVGASDILHSGWLIKSSWTNLPLPLLLVLLQSPLVWKLSNWTRVLCVLQNTKCCCWTITSPFILPRIFRKQMCFTNFKAFLETFLRLFCHFFSGSLFSVLSKWRNLYCTRYLRLSCRMDRPKLFNRWKQVLLTKDLTCLECQIGSI